MRAFRVMVVCVFALGIGAASVFAGGGPLDGQSFTINMKGPDGKDAPDDLVFKDGRFDSIACHEYGFGDAPYTAEKTGPVTTFKATTHSEKAGEFEWAATVSADGKIAGTATMKGKDGKTSVYQISGAKK